MAQQLIKLTCEWCTREDTEHESIEEAVEEGWYVLEGPDGAWDYCSIACLKAHVQ